MKRAFVFAPLLVVSLLLGACATAATPEPQTKPPVETSPAPTTPMSEGQQLFVSKGCAACHGQNAEGTNIAPSLAGHSHEQVERQVRAPIGSMPHFPEDMISDEELGEIIEFIEGIEVEHTHMHSESNGMHP